MLEGKAFTRCNLLCALYLERDEVIGYVNEIFRILKGIQNINLSLYVLIKHSAAKTYGE
jgi:hypothetical protein